MASLIKLISCKRDRGGRSNMNTAPGGRSMNFGFITLGEIDLVPKSTVWNRRSSTIF
jgi:hypothetical protein